MKMKHTHTHAPWHCYQPQDSPRQITDGTMRICTMTNRSQEIANARLITAAPELLEACKILLRLHYDTGAASAKGLEASNLAEDAIRKATR